MSNRIKSGMINDANGDHTLRRKERGNEKTMNKTIKRIMIRTAALLLLMAMALSSCSFGGKSETAFDPEEENESSLPETGEEDAKTGSDGEEESETREEVLFTEEEVLIPENTSEPEPEEEAVRILDGQESVTGKGNIALSVRSNLDPDKPMIALTFDDGPSAYTMDIMALLEKYGGRSTFFVVGEMLEKRSEELQHMIDEGHEIASHTWSHTNLRKVSKEEGKEAMNSVITYIKDNYGYSIKLCRPPYGASNATVKEEAGELGIALVIWSVDTLDWSTRNAEATFKAIKKEAKDGAIILCHDIHKPTAESMKQVIPWLHEEGYQLVTVQELLYYKNEGATAGKTYYSAG